ncbi:hypothetical protein [Spirosoma sp. KNUC1025]|uniref:hypothetical protein n=1 Tax=Spirosoma sp. KNUC1025 TaxID=2894082 RepID=UPI003863AC39|nr:hypothetical protein LN737_06405 [Spirosoma sp. KNUC1025]
MILGSRTRIVWTVYQPVGFGTQMVSTDVGSTCYESVGLGVWCRFLKTDIWRQQSVSVLRNRHHETRLD